MSAYAQQPIHQVFRSLPDILATIPIKDRSEDPSEIRMKLWNTEVQQATEGKDCSFTFVVDHAGIKFINGYEGHLQVNIHYKEEEKDKYIDVKPNSKVTVIGKCSNVLLIYHNDSQEKYISAGVVVKDPVILIIR